MKIQSMDQLVCAVIVSFNAPNKLVACLISVLPQVNKVVVIDNKSDQGTHDAIVDIGDNKKIEIIYNNINMGLGYAFNQGIRYSTLNGYQWTLLLDQDSVLDERMIENMLFAYNKLEKGDREKTMLLSPRIYDKNLLQELPALITTRTRSIKIYGSIKDIFIHFQISSGSLLKRELISKIGLLNEKLFIDSIDYDYCFRVLDNGYYILQCGNACLKHSLGEINNKFGAKYSQHSASRVYFQTRNGLFIIYKYGRKYRSIAYAEIYRLVGKIPRIIFLETNKVEKIKMYFKGIKDFILYHKQLE